MLMALGSAGNAAEISASFVEPPRGDSPAPPRLERASATADIERGQAVNGSTVLSPVLYGAGNNYSYFRFANGTGSTATFSATLVGSPTGTNYGTMNITVAANASPQYSITDIFTALRISGPSASDRQLSLYVTSQHAGRAVSVQHVNYNSQNGFFENLSVCTYRSGGVDYSYLSQQLTNVHTSLISGYPSTVYFHNFYALNATYRANVYKAGTGAFLGTLTLGLAANDTAVLNMADVERTLNYTPGPGEYHVNMFFSADTVTFNGMAVQSINNQQLNSLTNISSSCLINP